jgi:hypothetical protein
MTLPLRATAFAILAAAFCAAPVWSQAKPNLTGTWKLNPQKSDFGGDSGPDSLVVKVDHKNDILKYTASGSVNGQDFVEEVEIAIDGKEHPAPNGMPGTMMMKWDGPAIAFELKMDDGTVLQKGRVQLSSDGKVMTRNVQGKGPDGGDMKRTEVYEKQ